MTANPPRKDVPMTTEFDKYGPCTTTYTDRLIRSGQPRAYADHERVHEVTVTETDRHGNTRPHPWVRYADESGRDQIVDRVRYLVAGDTPFRQPGPMRSLDEHARHYVDYANVTADGVIEVRVVEPYID